MAHYSSCVTAILLLLFGVFGDELTDAKLVSDMGHAYVSELVGNFDEASKGEGV